MQHLVVILQIPVRPCILAELIAILRELALLPSVVTVNIEISNAPQKLTRVSDGFLRGRLPALAILTAMSKYSDFMESEVGYTS